MRLRVLMVLLLVMPGLWAAPPVAMVTDLAGELSLSGQPVVLLEELGPGVELDLAADSRLTLVLYATGQEYRLEGPSKVQLSEQQVLVNGTPSAGAELLLSAEGARLSSANLSQAAILMRATAPAERLVDLTYPAWSNILEPRPVFSWRVQGEGEKAYSYRLEILSEKGKSLFVGNSDIGRFRLPKAVELPKGERLTWELEAKKGDEMVFASADFRIATDAEVQRVDQLGAQIGEDFGRRVLFARYLEANGFKHDAEHYWQMLSAQHPDVDVLREKVKQ